MDFDLEEALRRYPLPDEVEDQRVNRTLCARALSVSENIITKYLDQGMPVVSRGSNGQAYEFLLSECYAWKCWKDAESKATREAGERAANQLALLFRNNDEDDADEGPTLTARQIAEESDADYRRSRAAELRGELVRKSRMQALLEDLLMQFRTALVTLPDFAEMEFGLGPAEVDKLQRRCDEALMQAGVRIREELVDRPGEVRTIAPDGGQESLPV